MSTSGLSKGTLTPTYDEAVNKDVLELDYRLAQGEEVALWARGFPVELGPAAANKVAVGLRALNPGELRQISVRLEIVGPGGTQTVPLPLRGGWNSFQESIDWKTISDLGEVRLVVSPAEGTESAKGTLSFALEFVKQAPRKAATLRKTPAFGLLDAGEKGIFNIGPSSGFVTRIYDETLERDVWKFDYSLPAGAVVGVWSKSFPPELGAGGVDAIRLGVKAPDADQLGQVSLKVEIKGSASMQTLPLSLKLGWNSFRELLHWNSIGTLKEVVFVVSPMAANVGGNPLWFSPTEAVSNQTEPVTGTLYFDFDFGRVTFFEKYSTFLRIGLVLVMGLLLAWGFSLLGLEEGQRDRKASPPSGIQLDFIYGVVAVSIIGMALWIYSIGAANHLGESLNLNFLLVGLVGVLVAGFVKFTFTGRHLAPGEVFQNVLVAGLLAVSSSREELLQAPAGWDQVFLTTNLTASLAFLIYHISNTCSLVTSGRSLRAVTSALIVGTPYLFGWLLVLENATLLEKLAGGVTFGLLTAWPQLLEILGRLLIVLGFNEAVTNGLHVIFRGRMLKSPKAHLVLFLVSLGVVVSPLVAGLGSGTITASMPLAIRSLIAILTTLLSFGGLWAEVYLITGMFLDSGRHNAPSEESISKHVVTGMKKGAAYSGILMAILYGLNGLLHLPQSRAFMAAAPLWVGVFSGALVFPFLKTIIETFDGSLPFFERVRHSYRSGTLWARGAVVGWGFSYMVTGGLFQAGMSERIPVGLLIGLLASGGMSFLRDTFYSLKGQGRLQSWRLYGIDGLLGAFVGSAVAFYLDTLQVPVVIEKFRLYTSAGLSSVDYVTYPFLNKWGRIDLGSYTGGAKLLFIESLAGVINWSIAAWLFAINKVFLQAFFDKDKTPIQFFFSKAGFAQLLEHMIYVLRWGLWMSPIIFTFLRMMPDPTWYNQDGAIRTGFAIFHNVTMSPEAFQAWSLNVFVYLMAFDFFRILIWMDHMGLRVATLVNLSFLGMDKLDERIARFIGPAAAQRYIPEGVKRFTTWAPLLIPFYLPRGPAWDYAWSTSEAIQNAGRGKGLLSLLQSLSLPQMLLLIGLAIPVGAVVSFIFRSLYQRSLKRRIRSYELHNREYKLVLKENGEAYSELIHKECDISRRSYDTIDPSGRVLYLVDTSAGEAGQKRAWPVVGNFPRERFEASQITREGDALKVVNTTQGIRTTIVMSLPDQDSTAEVWTLTVENLTAESRQLKVVPYLEWVLNGGIHDRFHTQYARLYPEMEFVSGANAVLSWQKSTKSMGVLAVDLPTEGFLTSRMDFIGRARSIWSPRILETLNFLEPVDTAPHPTFDPIGSLLVDLGIGPNTSRSIRLVIGYAKNREAALQLVETHLRPKAVKRAARSAVKKSSLIGHGEIPSGTPQPYFEYRDHGRTLVVCTPYTPRPFDHTLSNAVHSVLVTNRGLHTSSNGNSQQNRLTPDWADTVTKEIPSEAIYLYDLDQNEWYSPTHHPLNDGQAKNEAEFSVEGTATFHMTRGTLATQLTVFVPPDDPAGIYLLTLKNHADYPRRMRIAPYFQMTLGFMPERSGPLVVRRDRSLGALFFENPRNLFRSGWAFVSMSIPAERMETKRGRFFGQGRGVTHPLMVETGKPDTTSLADSGQIAGFLGTVEIPAQGECTVAVILGETDDLGQASRLVQKYKNLETVRASLDQTRKWWLGLMKTVEVETNQPEFDQFQSWLKYQALAERIWARRGFYQSSGAYGFRDQLQDTVNLVWVDPVLARKQIRLHAAQQFLEGDVFHWFFTLTDGRTAFSCRSHASDNPLWLAWAVGEYLRATGDDSILDEMTSYVVSEFPFAPLPKNKQGWGHLYHRSTRSDTIYKHCLRSIDLVLEKRIGKHGLPLMGTGDWNDGLDEIGSEGRGESTWVGFFLYCILREMISVIEKKEGPRRREHYLKKMEKLKSALEQTWRGDRYLRAIHDDGTEIGVKGSGIWEIDALTAAWAVMSGIHFERGATVFDTALGVLEKEDVILLGWPALRENTKPYLGRSSKYPEGVRENGMYCHGVQWLVKAARILAEEFEKRGHRTQAGEYRQTAYRLWHKIAPLSHATPQKIEIYGGQPNKQAADLLTTFDPGRMIWNGYTGAAGWMLRQALEGVVGASLIKNELVLPADLSEPRGELKVKRVTRNVEQSPFGTNGRLRENRTDPVPQKSVLKRKVKLLPPEFTLAGK